MCGTKGPKLLLMVGFPLISPPAHIPAGQFCSTDGFAFVAGCFGAVLFAFSLGAGFSRCLEIGGANGAEVLITGGLLASCL